VKHSLQIQDFESIHENR